MSLFKRILAYSLVPVMTCFWFALILIGLVIALCSCADASSFSAKPEPQASSSSQNSAQLVSSVPQPQITEREAANQRAVDTFLKLTADCRLTEMGPAHDQYHERNEADLLAQIVSPASYAIDGAPFNGIEQNKITAIQYKNLLDKNFIQIDAHDHRMLISHLRATLYAEDIEEIKSKLSLLNNELMQIRASCSTVSAYMTETGKEALKFMKGLNCSASFQYIIRRWQDNRNIGFTPLMRAAARGNKEIVGLLTAEKANLFTQLRLCPWMSGSKATINESALATYIYKDQIGQVNRYYDKYGYRDNAPLAPLLENMQWLSEHPLFYLTHELDALSLAVIGGQAEVVDLLINAMLDDLRMQTVISNQTAVNRVINTLNRALYKLIYYSDIIKTDLMDEVLSVLGIPEKPNLEAYTAIAKKLFQAALRIFHLPDDGKYRVGSDEDMKNLLITAMRFGSPEMLRAVAEAYAQTSVQVNYNYPLGFYIRGRNFYSVFEELIHNTNSGEKMGVLLSINAHTYSLVYQLSRGMLYYLEENPKAHPEFLNRLKSYMHEQENALIGLNGEIAQKLIPDLAAIVEDYADPRRIPADVAERILAIDRPVAPKPPVEQKEKEEKSSSSSSPSPAKNKIANALEQTKKQILIDQLNELQTIATKHKLERAKMPILHALQLLKTQPYTKDVVTLVKMLVTAIDPKPKIQYFGQPVTVNFLLEPLVSGLTREINRLS